MSNLIDTLGYSASFSIIAIALFLLARLRNKRLLIPFGLTFALYLGVDDLLTALGSKEQFAVIHGDWNWSGKIYSIALSFALILALQIDRKASGIVLPYKNNRSSLLLMFFLIALSATLGLIFSPSSPDLETLAFQATMPGLAEELTYRGVAPALLLGLFNRRHETSGSLWSAILVTALMFSIWHGLGLKGGAFTFDLVPASFTLIGGLAYGWLRFNSGSLLYPVIAHCAGNLVFQLVPLIGT